jgi:hypothetical protein
LVPLAGGALGGLTVTLVCAALLVSVPSLTISWNTNVWALLLPLGAVKLGFAAVALESVTLAPESCDQAYVSALPSGSLLPLPV